MLAVLLLVGAIVWSPAAWAVDPSHSITQYGHRSWRLGEAGLDHAPSAIAQTTDGQIWFGTTDGLYRFDGQRFNPWKPTNGPDVKIGYVEDLLGARNGELYVAARTGVYRVAGGRYYKYPELKDGATRLGQDATGTVWVAKLRDNNRPGVCTVGPLRIRCIGPDNGFTCARNDALATVNRVEIWAGGYSGICHWRLGHPNRVYPIGDAQEPVTNLAFDGRQTLWATVGAGGKDSGLWQFSAGAWHRFQSAAFGRDKQDLWNLLADKQGSLWVGSGNRGLFRIVNGRVDHFDRLDGLASNTLGAVFEDREGSIWVSSTDGLDQFFDLPLTRFGTREGLAGDQVVQLSAGAGGSVLVSTNTSMQAVKEVDRRVELVGFPSWLGVRADFSDDAGRFWFSGASKITTLQRGRSDVMSYANTPLLPRQFLIWGMAEDARHNVWAAGQDYERPTRAWLWRFDQGRLVERLMSPADGGRAMIGEIASDLAGDLWVSVEGHGLYRLHNSAFQRVEAFDARVFGEIAQIAPITAAEVWLATDAGAVQLVNNHVRVLDVSSGLPCNKLYGVGKDPSGALWLTTQCGLVQVLGAELAKWRLRPSYRIHARTFGSTAGYIGDKTSRLVRSGNGNLWFPASFSLFELDPAHIPIVSATPPIEVQGIVADQQPYRLAEPVILPQLTRNLEIDYAGLSYNQPSLLTFRYRLIGHDKDWIAAGNRRQAFYNDLPPGSYTFHVTVCNQDAICNQQGSSVEIRIPPAWWQTWLFRSLCIAAIVTAIAVASRWRLKARDATMRLRFNDRLEERTRVARDLHDTMMQTVLASKLLAEGGQMLGSITEARAVFTRLSEWLGSAADEGRVTVRSLRSSIVEANHLAGALELAALEGRADGEPNPHVEVIGEIRELHPIVRDEIHRIGVEAIRNARVHSGAANIYISLIYGRNLTLRVRDDGHGMDGNFVIAGKADHYGLLGMRERAEHVGGKLALTSSTEGTEVSLVLPGKAVFADGKGALLLLTRLLPRRIVKSARAPADVGA